MAMGQLSRPGASRAMRICTGSPISSNCIRILLLGLVTSALILLPLLELTQASPAHASPAHASPAHASPATTGAPELYYGLVYPGAPDIPTLSTYETRIGKGVSIVMWYQAWDENNQMQSFPTAQMQEVREHGSIPMLAWEPAANPGALNQPAFSLAKIADGTWDRYLRQYAREVKAWGHPFFLRFASEMNGGWVSWFEGNSGNSPGQFVLAWRHVHDIFASVGATNVSWVWCPNDEDAYTTPLEDLYPGNAYVDWAGIDGYNFSIDLNGAPWRSFSTIFSETYHHMLRLIPPTMPVMIGETGSVEDGGSKAAWITDALSTQLPTKFPRIKALVWFEDTDGNLNLRFDTSPSSLAAFQHAIAASTYQANTYSTLHQSPIPAPEQVVLPPPPTPSPSPSPTAAAPTPGLLPPPISVSYFSGPSPGTVRVLDAVHNLPVPGATLVYQYGFTATTDSSGVSRQPSLELRPVLEQIVVGKLVIRIRLILNLQRGYRIQINLATAQVTKILVHVLVNLWPLVIQIALFVPLVIIALTLLFRRVARRKRRRQIPEQVRRYPTLMRSG